MGKGNDRIYLAPVRIGGTDNAEPDSGNEATAEMLFDVIGKGAFMELAHKMQGRVRASQGPWMMGMADEMFDGFVAVLDGKCVKKVSYADFFKEDEGKTGMIAVRPFESHAGKHIFVLDAESVKPDPSLPPGGNFYLIDSKEFASKSPYVDRSYWEIHDIAVEEHGEKSDEVKVVDRTVEILRQLLFKTLDNLDDPERKKIANELRRLNMRFNDLVINVLKDFLYEFNDQLYQGCFDSQIENSELDEQDFIDKVLTIGKVDLQELANK